MKKLPKITRRESLIYGALLLPLNVFLKLYLRDQEKYSQFHIKQGKS